MFQVICSCGGFRFSQFVTREELMAFKKDLCLSVWSWIAICGNERYFRSSNLPIEMQLRLDKNLISKIKKGN